ncbi:MAG: sugar phosphate isomerase/epimerase family protein [Eubacteriales bacterium]
MKTAVSFFTFDEKVNIREAMEQSKKAGYDGVELILSETGSLNMKTTEKEILAMRTMADDQGLSVCSVGAWNLWVYNLVSDDQKTADYAKDIITKQLDIAAALGADTILVIPGWVGTPFAPGIISYDVAYERAQEAIGKLADHAKSVGVCIGVENVWNKFLLSPLEMRRFVDEISSEYVGVYFDVGNIIYIGYPDQWMRILGKRIKKLHFCDCRFDSSGLNMFVDLFEGDVDFEAVMHAARDIGYDDWATVEFLPNYRRFPYQSIINARLSLDTILRIK